ncbi:hypothetical protein ABT124_03280 [Streptomyces sp. NPDC001982]|uniref:hypothetical protein n=1 Tax=Streptomyces sp. NPDC001982 TaxID=3154405 RepID=UPI00331FD5E8
MTATLHIARRTTPHHPRTTLRARWQAFQLRHSCRAQAAYFTQLHDALPLDDPDRHALESPVVENAFVRIAADHPHAVARSVVRTADHAQMLLATCDSWFRDVHGPEHRWDPRTITAYNRLMADVRACFDGGTS